MTGSRVRRIIGRPKYRDERRLMDKWFWNVNRALSDGGGGGRYNIALLKSRDKSNGAVSRRLVV